MSFPSKLGRAANKKLLLPPESMKTSGQPNFTISADCLKDPFIINFLLLSFISSPLLLVVLAT